MTAMPSDASPPGLDLHFIGGDAHLGDENVAEALRAEDVGAMASQVSAWPQVREALRQLQLSFRRVPGLVADGRDMGTVIFPGAEPEGVSDRERRHARRKASQAVDFKGNSG